MVKSPTLNLPVPMNFQHSFFIQFEKNRLLVDEAQVSAYKGDL